MKLYVNIKKLNFEEENNLIEHEIILSVSDKEFYGYDIILELPDDNKFIKDTLKIIYKKDKEGKDTEEIESKVFVVREQDTWNSFSIYEIISGKIVSFNYMRYQYFANTNRRVSLAKKINQLYNPPSEAKLVRKALKIILDKLSIDYPEFQKYYDKIEDIINKNPKN